MMVYVLSFFGNGELPNCVDGVYGVFTTREGAFTAVGHACDAMNEIVYDFDCDMTLWRFFTNKGTYVVECMGLDDEGAI